jgi:RNA-directed DNA polymerase
MASITRFLEKKLRLKVNQEKSAVAPVWERKYLGYRLLRGGKLGIAPQSLERAKERIRKMTRRNRSISFEERIEQLNSFLSGWITYFRLAECRSHLADLDQWIRRKLRCVRLKQCKRTRTIAGFLQECGVREYSAWMLALSGKGWWRMADTPQAHRAMSNAWFSERKLVCLLDRYLLLQTKGNRRGTEQVCPVV